MPNLRQEIESRNTLWNDSEGRLFMVRFCFELLRDTAETDDEATPRILEIGVDRGSLVFMLYSVLDFDQGLYTGVDPNSRIPFDPDTFLFEGQFLPMTSEQFWKEDERKWHLIFVDGCHDEKVADLDVREAVTRLEPNGILLVHDVRDDGGPRRAFIRHCLENPTMSGFFACAQNVCATGMGIGYRKGSRWEK